MPDKQRFQAVVEGYTSSSFANYTEGVGTLRSNGGDLGGGSETLVAEPIAYHFDALSSNSMKSSNPDSGVNEVDTARTLDTWRPDPSLNQGGLAIVEPAIVFNDDRRIGPTIHGNTVSTLQAFMGTGGNNTPMVAHAIPIQDGREIEKNQNGLGIAEAGSPAYTLDQTGAQAVAYGIQGNMIGRQDHNGPGGTGVSKEDGPMYTLTSTDIHAVAISEPTLAFDTQFGSNANVTENVSPTLKSSQQSPSVAYNAEPTMAVRRLTPLECERLMGWPDDHTRYKTDGTEQADTHRYKQAGNGVASPVAQWIAKHILAI
jgi:DNA (cytosine-5)-methyltransferase 1